MKLAFQIAWRFLTSAKRQTLIIILGISVGVSVQVFIGSLISGLQDNLVETAIGSSSHITVVEDNNGVIDDVDGTIQLLSNQSDLFTVITPVFDLPGILEKGTDKTEILYRGLEFDSANGIYKFDERMVEGTIPDALDEIALGIKIKEELDLNVNDTITIEIIGGFKTLTIVGFFDIGVAQLNRSWGVGTIETLQAIASSTGATRIETQIS
ncbi:MAG TPA: ABC transporter permease, partial [Acholeplasmataceae bacterium]|nr:ABC transporter permease [Acholeplasmataceae bacterium]